MDSIRIGRRCSGSGGDVEDEEGGDLAGFAATCERGTLRAGAAPGTGDYG